jgi:uncharacterized membrane protein
MARDAEQTREKGRSLLMIGGMILFFDVLILFFLPAGLKLGHKTAFIALMGPLAVLGLVLIVSGYVIRAKAE